MRSVSDSCPWVINILVNSVNSERVRFVAVRFLYVRVVAFWVMVSSNPGRVVPVLVGAAGVFVQFCNIVVWYLKGGVLYNRIFLVCFMRSQRVSSCWGGS